MNSCVSEPLSKRARACKYITRKIKDPVAYRKKQLEVQQWRRRLEGSPVPDDQFLSFLAKMFQTEADPDTLLAHILKHHPGFVAEEREAFQTLEPSTKLSLLMKFESWRKVVREQNLK